MARKYIRVFLPPLVNDIVVTPKNGDLLVKKERERGDSFFCVFIGLFSRLSFPVL